MGAPVSQEWDAGLFAELREGECFGSLVDQHRPDSDGARDQE